jgi:hypothetical protein
MLVDPDDSDFEIFIECCIETLMLLSASLLIISIIYGTISLLCGI